MQGKTSNGDIAMRRGGLICLINVLLWLCSDDASLAQSNYEPHVFVFGRVIDKQTSEPIPDVNILIVGTQGGTTSDSTGRFFFGPFTAGLYVLEFSHVSYARIQQTRLLRPGDSLVCIVELVKRSIVLDPVEVTANVEKSPAHWHGVSGLVLTRKDIEGSGARRLSDVMRRMAPGAYVLEMGPDLIIDLNRSSRRNLPRSAFRDYPNTNPLIILNGAHIGKSPQSLNLLIKPDEIDEIVVIKGTEAQMYGYEGRDGVILVTTTPQLDTSGLSFFEKVMYISGVFVVAVLAWVLIFQ